MYLFKVLSQLIIMWSIVDKAKSDVNSVKYTNASFTVYGEPCLNDCVNSKCIVNWKGEMRLCFRSDEVAPTYYTTQTQAKPTCLSNCGKFGYSYEWCLVSNDFDWDYCSSETATKWVKNQQDSLYYGPCADSCELDGPKYMCTNFHGYRSECNPKKYNYIKAKTIYGDECVGKCYKHNSSYTKYYWCENKKQKQVKCAPPAQAPSLQEFSKDLLINNCAKNSKRNKRSITNFKVKKSRVLTAATNIEQSNYFQTIGVNENRNPVYSYTVKMPQNDKEPILPLVVKAKIAGNTIQLIKRAKISVEASNNLKQIAKLPGDEASNLIGYQIGGQNKFFNMVPQRKSARIAFATYENEIKDWVKKSEDNTVDLVIVVVYENSTRPRAFGLDIVFNQNDKVFKSVNDVIYNINPGQEVLMCEPKIISTTPRSVDGSTVDVDIGLW